jgi:hypothetical protein
MPLPKSHKAIGGLKGDGPRTTNRKGQAMRKAIVSWTLLLSLVGVFQPAKADFRSGLCALSMHFQFSPALKLGGAAAVPKSWTLDYNSVTCLVSPTQVGDALIRSSWGHVVGDEGTGNGLAWTCEALLGDALWSQGFDPFMPVPPARATLALSAGQGATIIISSNTTSFQGIITVDSVPSLAQCAAAGLDDFNATGIMVFHDPELPQ